MTHGQPRMMTIRQVAATGLLPENALRTLEKQGRLNYRFCISHFTKQ